MSGNYIGGTPGIKTERTTYIREILLCTLGAIFLPVGKLIAGSVSRDPGNSDRVDILRAGLLMGKVTSTGKYAPSIIGTLGVDYAGTATQMNILPAALALGAGATEIARRCGASGTFKITGPQAAGGRVRTRTVTYSSVGAGSGVNEVQTFTPDAAASAGTYRIKLQKSDGTSIYTAAIAYGATLATCQAAITLALGGVAGWVASSAGSAAPWSAGPIALVLTASGTGYTVREFPMCEIEITSLTGVTTMTSVETTKGVPVAGTVTCTAMGLTAQNEVQTWTPAAAWTAGTITFGIVDSAGGRQWVKTTYTTDLAGTLAAINVLLDARFGTGAIVATGGGNITSVVFTFSGGAYAGREQPLIMVDYTGGTGAVTAVGATVFRTTAGDSAGFIAGSFIQPTDGSETIRTMLANKYGIKVTDEDNTSIDEQYPDVLVAGQINTANIVNYPTDTALIAWLKAQLRAQGGVWTFSDDF